MWPPFVLHQNCAIALVSFAISDLGNLKHDMTYVGSVVAADLIKTSFSPLIESLKSTH